MRDKSLLVACSQLDFVLISRIVRNDFLLEQAEDCAGILNLLIDNNHKYDLLIVGSEWLKADYSFLALLPKDKKIPVVVLCSDVYEVRQIRKKYKEVAGCYVKPFHFHDFKALVTEYTLS